MARQRWLSSRQQSPAGSRRTASKYWNALARRREINSTRSFRAFDNDSPWTKSVLSHGERRTAVSFCRKSPITGNVGIITSYRATIIRASRDTARPILLFPLSSSSSFHINDLPPSSLFSLPFPSISLLCLPLCGVVVVSPPGVFRIRLNSSYAGRRWAPFRR